MLRDLFTRLRQSFLGSPDAEATIAAVERADHISGMDRRAFLRTALIGLSAAGVVDVDKLLWMPGEKTILIPDLIEIEAVCGNRLVSADWVAREALRILEKNLTFAAQVNRSYERSYENVFIALGHDYRWVA